MRTVSRVAETTSVRPTGVVRNRVIVAVESDVGRFACLNLRPLLAGEGVIGERDEAGAFFCEDVGDGALWVLGTGALGGAG